MSRIFHYNDEPQGSVTRLLIRFPVNQSNVEFRSQFSCISHDQNPLIFYNPPMRTHPQFLDKLFP